MLVLHRSQGFGCIYAGYVPHCIYCQRRYEGCMAGCFANVSVPSELLQMLNVITACLSRGATASL